MIYYLYELLRMKYWFRFIAALWIYLLFFIAIIFSIIINYKFAKDLWNENKIYFYVEKRPFSRPSYFYKTFWDFVKDNKDYDVSKIENFWE